MIMEMKRRNEAMSVASQLVRTLPGIELSHALALGHMWVSPLRTLGEGPASIQCADSEQRSNMLKAIVLVVEGKKPRQASQWEGWLMLPVSQFRQRRLPIARSLARRLAAVESHETPTFSIALEGRKSALTTSEVAMLHAAGVSSLGIVPRTEGTLARALLGWTFLPRPCENTV